MDKQVLELKDTCKVRGHHNHKMEYISVNEAHQEIFKCGYCLIDQEGSSDSSIFLKQIASSGFLTVFKNLPNLDATKRFYGECKKLVSFKPFKKVEEEWNNQFQKMKENFLDLFEKFKFLMEDRIKSKENSIKQILLTYNKMIDKKALKDIIFDQVKTLEEKKFECKDHFSRVQKNREENTKILEEGTKQLSILLKFNEQEFIQLFEKSVFSQLHCFIDLLNSENQNIENLLKNKESFLPKDIEKQIHNLQNAIEPVSNNFKDLIFLQLKKIDQPTSEKGAYFSQYYNKYKETLDPEAIFKIIQNPTNFCSPEYLEAIKKALESCGSILKLFPAPAKSIKQSYEVSLNELQHIQLISLAKLADTIGDLNTKEKERYRNSGSPQKNIQYNSYQIMKYLRDIRPLSLRDTISELLVDFPIFEYSKNINFGFPLLIKFNKTNYHDSGEIDIINDDLGVNFSIGSQKKGQIVSEILNHSKAYQLKLKFNCSNEQDRKVNFKMGLIDNELANTQFLGEKRQKLGQQNKKLTIKKRKGNLLNTDELNSQLPELEFRWCIKKRLLFILDSTYQHIDEVDYSDLSDRQHYRFAIWFSNQLQTDWSFQIMEFSEIKEENLEIFD